MLPIKHMRWKDELRTQRFELVVPNGFKDDLSDYCSAYKAAKGRYISSADVIVEQISHFLANNKLQHKPVKKAKQPKPVNGKGSKKKLITGKQLKALH